MNAASFSAFEGAATVPCPESWKGGRPGEPGAFIRPYDALDSGDRKRWAELTQHAGSTNVFAHDWFMDAAIAASDPRDRPDLLVVAEGGTWLGVLPLASDETLGRWPLRSWRLWSATNQFLLTPLVLPQAADRFWREALGALDALGGRGALHCPLLSPESPVTRALFAHCREEGRACYPLESIHRPARLAQLPPDLREAPSRKSLRKFESRMRNLAARLGQDHGELAYALIPDGASPEPWIDTFLELERSGWKGQAGSALVCDAHTEELFRTVIRRAWERGAVHLAALAAGGRPVAMTSWFTAGKQGFGFKMAYDEACRDYAPGQLLMQFVHGAVAADLALDFDTCSAPDSQNCRYLWPDRQEVLGCVVEAGSLPRRLMLRSLMAARAAARRLRDLRPG